MKKFWKKTEGFTLVELIVVIAILGILAGVGTVGYSGYIKKANMAADEQLLASLNSAFAAACAANGESHVDRRDVSITLDGEVGAKKVDETSIEVTGISNFTDTFDTFFEDGEFKVISDLYYSSVLGSFLANNVTELTLNGQKVVVDDAAIENLINSTWGDIGSEDLMHLVANVSDMALAIDNATFATMKNSAEFSQAAMAILGGEGTYAVRLFELATQEADKAAAAGNFEVGSEEYNTYRSRMAQTIDANTTIMVAAKNSKAGSQTIIDTLTNNGGTGAKDTIKGLMTNDPTNGLAQAALAYGLYNSYQYTKDPTSFNPAATIDFSAALNSLNDTGFQEYLNSDQAKKDLDGYMAAMDTLTTNGTAVTDAGILVNGFDNQELITLMQSVIGK